MHRFIGRESGFINNEIAVDVHGMNKRLEPFSIHPLSVLISVNSCFCIYTNTGVGQKNHNQCQSGKT